MGKRKDKIKQNLDYYFSEINKIIGDAGNDDIPGLLGDGILNAFIEAIASPKENDEKTLYDYMLDNKNRLQIIALIRLVIQRNYSVKGEVEGNNVFVSPNHIQWYDDGVMFLQGSERFAGLLGLYQEGEVKFGVSVRDILSGENVEKEAVDFIGIDEMRKRAKEQSVPQSIDELESVSKDLEGMLVKKINEEGEYQRFLTSNPWVLGAQYKKIDSLKSFDDANIPDFTGIRVRDSARDIIEIKQPFLKLFTPDNVLRAEFNNAWNQAERYLDFARQEADYLKRQKGLFFDNPKCYLIIGFNLSKEQVKEIRRKERMNQAISILTYNDLLAMIKSTITFIRALKG